MSVSEVITPQIARIESQLLACEDADNLALVQILQRKQGLLRWIPLHRTNNPGRLVLGSQQLLNCWKACPITPHCRHFHRPPIAIQWNVRHSKGFWWRIALLFIDAKPGQIFQLSHAIAAHTNINV